MPTAKLCVNLPPDAGSQAVADLSKDREGAQNAVHLLGSFGKAAAQLLGAPPEGLAAIPAALLAAPEGEGEAEAEQQLGEGVAEALAQLRAVRRALKEEEGRRCACASCADVCYCVLCVLLCTICCLNSVGFDLAGFEGQAVYVSHAAHRRSAAFYPHPTSLQRWQLPQAEAAFLQRALDRSYETAATQLAAEHAELAALERSTSKQGGLLGEEAAEYEARRKVGAPAWVCVCACDPPL